VVVVVVEMRAKKGAPLGAPLSSVSVDCVKGAP
jgi:hypothetical protein